MARYFENTLNGHRKEIGASANLGAILFGPIYFAIQGAWGWAVTEFLVCAMLFAAAPGWAIVWIVLFQIFLSAAAVPIVSATYLSRGWREVGALTAEADVWAEPINKGLVVLTEPVRTKVEVMHAPQADANEKTCPQCAETVKSAAKICRFCRYEFPADVNSAVAQDG